MFSSCSNKKELPKAASIKLNVDVNEIKKIKYSSLFEFENILQFDSSNSIGRFGKVIVMKDKFLLKSKNRIIVENLITNTEVVIDHEGKGPGEYSIISDYLYSKENHQILILDSDNSKIVRYDLNGEFVSEARSKHLRYSKAFYYYDEGVFAIYGGKGFYDGSESYELKIVDISVDKILNSFFEIDPDQARFMHFIVRENFSQNQSLFFKKYDNNLYKIDHQELERLIEIDFGNQNLPDRILNGKFENVMEFMTRCRSSSYAHGVSNVLVSDELIFFTFEYNDDLIHAYYKKKEKALILVNKFNNDLYGLPLWTKTGYKNVPIGIDKSQLIFSVEPLGVKLQLEEIRLEYTAKQWGKFYEENRVEIDYWDGQRLDANDVLYFVSVK